MKIEITDEECDLDIKRCYLPIEITDDCPKCSKTVTKYINSDYLSYPVINQPFEVTMYHHIEHPDRDEEHDWKVKVILRVTMEAAP